MIQLLTDIRSGAVTATALFPCKFTDMLKQNTSFMNDIPISTNCNPNFKIELEKMSYDCPGETIANDMFLHHKRCCRKITCDAMCDEVMALNIEDEIRDILQEKLDEGA